MGAGRLGEEGEWGEGRLQTGRGFAESGEDLGFYPKGSKEGEGINWGWGGNRVVARSDFYFREMNLASP